MSYCRWSSDNFKSDVYVYESLDGWETHVAGSRLIGEAPFEEYMEVIHTMSPDEWTQRYKEREAWFESARRKKIGLSHDGQSFCDESPQDCAKTLTMLKEEGYHIPDGVIEELMEEK